MFDSSYSCSMPVTPEPVKKRKLCLSTWFTNGFSLPLLTSVTWHPSISHNLSAANLLLLPSLHVLVPHVYSTSSTASLHNKHSKTIARNSSGWHLHSHQRAVGIAERYYLVRSCVICRESQLVSISQRHIWKPNSAASATAWYAAIAEGYRVERFRLNDPWGNPFAGGPLSKTETFLKWCKCIWWRGSTIICRRYNDIKGSQMALFAKSTDLIRKSLNKIED